MSRARPCSTCGRGLVWTRRLGGSFVPVLASTFDASRAVYDDEGVARYEPRRLGHVSHFRNECGGAARPEPPAPANAFTRFVLTLPAKTLYRALSRHLHPDVGGDLRLMQALNAAWDEDQRGGRR